MRKIKFRLKVVFGLSQNFYMWLWHMQIKSIKISFMQKLLFICLKNSSTIFVKSILAISIPIFRIYQLKLIFGSCNKLYTPKYPISIVKCMLLSKNIAKTILPFFGHILDLNSSLHDREQNKTVLFKCKSE